MPGASSTLEISTAVHRLVAWINEDRHGSGPREAFVEAAPEIDDVGCRVGSVHVSTHDRQQRAIRCRHERRPAVISPRQPWVELVEEIGQRRQQIARRNGAVARNWWIFGRKVNAS